MDGERSGEGGPERARAIVNSAVDERCRVDDGTPRQGRRGSEDFTRGSVDGVPSIAMLFSRGMAVQRQRADVPDERQREERQHCDRQ